MVTTRLHRCSRILVLLSLPIFGFIFATRLLQYVMMENQLFGFWLNDISLVLAPLLSIWQLLPLFYFLYIQFTMRFWFKSLRKSLGGDPNIGSSLPSAYEIYYGITESCRIMGNFFNPFIFFSLANSIAVLCIVIYFCINGDVDILEMPEDASLKTRAEAYFIPVWALYQILTAVLYLLCISISGYKTNEEVP